MHLLERSPWQSKPSYGRSVIMGYNTHTLTLAKRTLLVVHCKNILKGNNFDNKKLHYITFKLNFKSFTNKANVLRK
jgi:hypothetical protein